MNIACVDWIDSKNKSKSISCTAKDYYDFCGGNTGNLVHLNSYDKIFTNHFVKNLNFSDFNLINNQDLLLIKCANQIGDHFVVSDILFQHIEKINIPIILCCLGVQNNNFDDLNILSKDNRWPELLRIISSKKISEHPNISVRGEYSQKVLNYYGFESTVTGCISTMLFKDRLGTNLKNKYQTKKIKNICVAGSNPYDQASIWLEKKLRLIVEEHNGIHIAQSPLDIFALVHGQDSKLPDFFSKVYGMNDDEIKRWFIRYGRMFYSTDCWSYVMKLYDLVIGARYHGVAIGLQSEILGTIFSVDSRTKELALTNGIKHIDIDLLRDKTYKEILELSVWQAADYDYLDNQIDFCKNQFDLFFSQNKIKL